MVRCTAPLRIVRPLTPREACTSWPSWVLGLVADGWRSERERMALMVAMIGRGRCRWAGDQQAPR